jgi:hypothetical protein
MERNHRQEKSFVGFPRSLLFFSTLSLLFGCNFAATAAQGRSSLPVLSYRKVLKGSVPEYIEIKVDSQGSGTYDGRKLSDSPHPRGLNLSRATADRLFALAADLGDFKSITLESRRQVANMGAKTFGYEDGGQRWSVEFNYTENRTAQELETLFEGIANVEEHLSTLEYSVRYDPLGLPRELTYIQIDLDNKNLTDPKLLAPVLKQIASNPRFLHIAQVRAQDILDEIPSD